MEKTFDLTLARECAAAFSASNGLGCIVSDKKGATLAEYGYGCSACRICRLAGKPAAQCVRAQNYSMAEAERFGGRYIYYCPMGLTCFVSPLLGELDSCARITAGPFLMVEKEDFIDCELMALEEEQRARVVAELENVRVIPTATVNQMSTLLFMAVGFMNKVSASERMRQVQSADAIQGQINSYILQLKQEEQPPPYPFAVEKAFLRSIRRSEKDQARSLLNQLLGHILLATGQQLDTVKSRVCELLALTGRAAVEAGAESGATLRLCHESRGRIEQAGDIEAMCAALSDAVNRLMDSVFRYADMRHAHAIHLCMQHTETHYYEKVTLEQLAQRVFLSPAYLSRVFKEETGTAFNDYLNAVRIAKARQLLLHEDLRVTDVASAVGFDDQSYFTKVFRRVTGMTPLRYRTRYTQGEE
ncbi:helix-turn-helix domain-containing protein [Candidatus Allofournierella merdipullorum]|uniref:helix-turn-helix domain-containing protein n=1 Tax=Candidatus Allofournierella merdipullorum TaxID=2838595 RepID=UPI003AB47046